MARDPQQTPWERHGPAAALARSLRPGNRRWLTPLVALILMLALVAGALIVSSVTRRHVQLDDGTVWITSLNNRKAARFNVKVKQADAAVSSTATRFDVAQHDAVTILDEGGEASSIDASTVSPTEQVETGEGMTVLLGGDTVAFLDTQTGDVWTGEAEGLDGVDPTSQDPSMRLGAGGLATVDDNGVVYGLRVEDGAVLTLDGPQDASADQMGVIESAAGSGADSFTVVDGIVNTQNRKGAEKLPTARSTPSVAAPQPYRVKGPRKKPMMDRTANSAQITYSLVGMKLPSTSLKYGAA